MEKKLKGMVVAITGSSSGIGAAIAKTLAKHGACVVLGARREDRLKKIEKEIKESGGETVYTVTDVKNKEDLVRLVQTAVSAYGKLDVIVNNAGVGHISRIDELDHHQLVCK